MSATNYLYSSPDYTHYATVAANLNLQALDPKGQNRLCRRISCNGPVVGTAYDLVVVRGDGTSVTMSIVAGSTIEIQAKQITAAGTTAEKVGIYW